MFVLLNEVKLDPPGNDGDYEFVELLGEPLTGVGPRWLVAIEGDLDANPGQTDLAIELSRCAGSSCRFDEQGLLLLAKDSTHLPLPSVNWRESVELSNGALENGTTSLLVLEAPPDRIPRTEDWDLDDDGQLELPTDWRILDSVSWTDGSSDLKYSPIVLGPKPRVQAAWRCQDAPGADSWGSAQLQGEPSSLTLDLANGVLPGKGSGTLSPGSPNLCSASVPSAKVPAQSLEPVLANADNGWSAAGASAIPVIAGGGTLGLQTREETVTGAESRPLDNHTGAMASAGANSASSLSMRSIRATPHAAQAGTVGWWSPNPFAPTLNLATGGVGGAPELILNPHNGDTATAPAMPSGCDLSRAPVRRPVLLALGALLVAFARRRRRKRDEAPL